MALKKHKNKIDTMSLLNPRRKIFAGLLSMLISITAAVGLGLHLYATYKNLPGGVVMLEGLWIAALLGVAIAGVGLMKSSKGAMWALLGFWLIIVIGAVLQGFGWLLWGEPLLLGGMLEGFTAVGFLVGVLLLGCIIVASLIWATPHRSRNRYGMQVGTSIAGGVALIFAANMIAAAYPYQKDIEQFKRFGLSDKTKQILDKVDSPMRISAVYTAATTDPDTPTKRENRTETRKQLARVMELLHAANRYNPRIEVVDASGNVERMKLMDRIGTRCLADSDEQIRQLEKIQQQLPEIYRQLDAVKRRWANLPQTGYLSQWKLASELDKLVDAAVGKLKAKDNEARQKIASKTIPDYAGLLRGMVAQLQETNRQLDAFSQQIGQLSKLSGKIKTNSPKIRKALDECVAAFGDICTTVEKPNGKPNQTLIKLITAFRIASQKTLRASNALSGVAGANADFLDIVSTSKPWTVTVTDASGKKIRMRRNRYFAIITKDLQKLREDTAMKLGDENKKAQQKYLVAMRKISANFLTLIKAARGDTEKAITSLQNVDKDSRAIFELAKKRQLFAGVNQMINPLITNADKLQAIGRVKLAPELLQDNIIVIEDGDKFETISFDTAWPLVVRRSSIGQSDHDPQRFFNGGDAISSRILKLTHKKPFARILITTANPPIPKNAKPGSYPVRWDISPGELNKLYIALAEANFTFGEWDLNNEYPPPPQNENAPGENLQTILLVLPTGESVMPIPGLNKTRRDELNKQYREKIRRAINGGAAAIFMGTWLKPRSYGGHLIPRSYAFNPYLEKDWGIEVDAQYRVLEAIPQGDKFTINIQRFGYMLINNFPEAPPIGRGLRGRRLLWPNACPITVEKQLPRGVQIYPLLTIPDNMTNVWATSAPQKLGDELRQNNGLVEPHYGLGDISTPFAVAVAAVRSGDTKQKPARIVVLGMSGGFRDQYLNIRVNVTGEGYRTEPPPRSNPMVVVNAAYWLIGRDSYIANGPGGTKPVIAMSKTMRSWIWFSCVIALPLGLLAVGGVVMIVRKR
ncbi:MAG: hypothetical protein KAR11_00525 [Phycisphaerae bacterium]|nr:hypothetical protein [Phycisphaerae bacterium]